VNEKRWSAALQVSELSPVNIMKPLHLPVMFATGTEPDSPLTVWIKNCEITS
jgi:hypothetical protein